MAKGENIFRRRDGRWEARYSKGRELSGKIKYGYCLWILLWKNISRGQRESGKVQSGVSKWTAYANVQDEGPIFCLLSGVASHKEK